MLSTIALFASSRRFGNTGAVIDQVAGALAIEVVDLGPLNMSAFDYQHRNRGDDFEPLLHRVLSNDQVIFAAPVYWYSVPPPMKVFIDRVNDLLVLPELRERGRQLRGKRAYVVATSGIDEVSGAFMAMFQDTFAYLGMRYGGLLHVNCDGGYMQGVAKDQIQAFVELVRNAT